MVVFSPIGGRLADRYGRRLPSVAGCVVLTIGLLPLALAAGLSPYALLPCLALMGAGVGLSTAGLQASAIEALEPSQAGRRSRPLLDVSLHRQLRRLDRPRPAARPRPRARRLPRRVPDRVRRGGRLGARDDGAARAAAVGRGRAGLARRRRRQPLAATGSAPRRASSARTAGATSVPYSSIARIVLAWSRLPTVSWSRNRSCAKISCWKRIFSTTSCGAADEVRSAERARRLELVAAHRRPATLAPDLGHHRLERRPRDVCRFLRRVGDEPVRVDAEGRGGAVQLERRPAVDLGERREALGHAADDRERHRQAERAGPRRRGGIAADRDPHRERILEGTGVDGGAVERGAMAARSS